MMIKTLVIWMLMALMVGGSGEFSSEFVTEDGGGSVSVIGGADGPTSVFLAGKLEDTEERLVLVPKEDENEGIATLPLVVTMKAVAYENGALVVLIENQSGYDYIYGMEYSLQKNVDGEWQEVEAVEAYGWPKISLQVKDTEAVSEVYDLTVFGELSAGEYKLVKNELEAEFELAEP